jgi:hypothetical protein
MDSPGTYCAVKTHETDSSRKEVIIEAKKNARSFLIHSSNTPLLGFKKEF